jgi:release factor H-coupled RctB family protein
MKITSTTNVRLFASEKSWVEGTAIDQLYAAARLEGTRLAAGFPDLHPGKGGPVGAAFVMDNAIYPHLIGNDIGCGMGLFQTDLPVCKAKLDRWVETRFDLEHPWEGDVRAYAAEHKVSSTDCDERLGTIGGGNHFAELQAVEKVFDAREFACTGLGRDKLALLVHSGSRGVGERTLRAHVSKHQARGVKADSADADEYLRQHDAALRWAAANRALIAKRFATTLGAEARPLWDASHNSITPVETERGQLWVHRKGATPTGSAFAVVAGSRGSFSYVVKPRADSEANAWSIAHGAGRKWSRSESRLRMRERFRVPELVQTSMGSRVVCEQRELLYEEAPAAYKDIDLVVQDLVNAGLVTVVATLRPLLTYKTRAVRR